MQSKHYPDVEGDFGNWLAGFIDGEGCFLINFDARHGLRYYTCLQVKLRADDRPILIEICERTGLGKVTAVHPKATAPQACWRVSSKRDLVRLIELLDRFPLRAKKARDYATFREATFCWTAPAHAGRWLSMGALRGELRTGRSYSATAGGNEPEKDR